MAVFALVLLAILIILLTGTKGMFVPKVKIYTYMDDSAALARGAPVRLNGIVIGNVGSVDLSGDPTPRRTVRIEMVVVASRLAEIPVDSLASISAENVLGTKYINIKRGSSPKTVAPGGEIPSRDVSEFDEVVQSGYDVMVAARALLKRIDGVVNEMEAGKGTIGKLLVDDRLYQNLNATVSEAQKVTASLNKGEGTLGRLLHDAALYEEIRGSVRRLDTLLAGVERGEGTAGRLIKDPALYEEARKSVTELKRLTEDLNAGKGTAGKLLKDDELHRRIRDTVAKLENTLDRVNSGEGTIGQLLVNPSLYNSLNDTSREIHGLIKDFRANPKKFLRIKLALF